MWGALACTFPTHDPSEITDLTVVGLVAEPPHVEAGADYTLEVVVVEPDQRPVSVYAWQVPGDELLEAPLVGDRVSFTLRGTPEAEVWVLACVAWVCAPPSPAERADPEALLRTLPWDGVSAGTRSTWIADPEAPHGNPVLLEAPADPAADSLAWTVSAAEGHALARSLVGRLTPSWTATLVDGRFELEQPYASDLWLYVTDGLGGSLVWRSELDDDPP